MESIKDLLRKNTLGKQAKFRSKLVLLTDEEGNNEIGPDGKPLAFEVRQPTVAGRSEILKASGALNQKGGGSEVSNLSALQVRAVIECTFVPGTNDRVYSEADAPVLFSTPTGSYVDTLAEVALELLNVDPGEAKKKSSATERSSSLS